MEGQLTEGNRRVKIYMDTYPTGVWNGGEYIYRDYAKCTIKGFKKVLGAWYSYNSLYTYRNVMFTVRTKFDMYGKGIESGPPVYGLQYHNYPGPVESPYEDWEYYWTWPVGDIFTSPTPQTFDAPYFTQVAGEARSRGTTGWASISCGY